MPHESAPDFDGHAGNRHVKDARIHFLGEIADLTEYAAMFALGLASDDIQIVLHVTLHQKHVDEIYWVNIENALIARSKITEMSALDVICVQRRVPATR